MTISTSIETVCQLLEKARKNAPLAAKSLTLLGASKGQPESRIREAIGAGMTDFGENRVQEAQGKWPELKKAFPGVRLHLIGPLQSNKVEDALGLFDVIQTIDRIKLAETIAKYQKPNARCQKYFIQVNIGKESQKAGVMPEEADELIRYCRDELALPVAGLMCIPPALQPPAPHFAMLREMAMRHGLTELSMGMSDDFETAVRMGSTCVRLGRIVFGERSA